MSAPHHELRPRESVLLAVDFEALRIWYQEALGFEQTRHFEEDYHYANLENSHGLQIGIADATEMGVKPEDRNKNTVLLQVEVADVRAFLKHITASGGKVLFGPSFEEKGTFWFGSFADPEGNPWWVVDSNCP